MYFYFFQVIALRYIQSREEQEKIWKAKEQWSGMFHNNSGYTILTMFGRKVILPIDVQLRKLSSEEVALILLDGLVHSML